MVRAKLFSFLSGAVLLQAAQLPFQVQRIESMNPFATTSNLPNIFDILTVSPSASIFHDYLRSSSSLSSILSSSKSSTTLFVPVNSFITSLAQKPHQTIRDSSGIEIGTNMNLDDEEEEEKNLYLELWLQRHMISLDTRAWNPKEGKEGGVWESMLEGKFIQVEKEGQDWIVNPGKIKVISVTEGSNGRVVLIAGVVSLDN